MLYATKDNNLRLLEINHLILIFRIILNDYDNLHE
jgi:hypothetical protein